MTEAKGATCSVVNDGVGRSTALPLTRPISPILVYATAAAHDLNDLAIAVSSHLLSFPLYTLSDELAARIGPVYLKRLCFLQLGRLEKLLTSLRAPPNFRPEMDRCDSAAQKRLARAWELASAWLAWDARPGVYPSRPLPRARICLDVLLT